MKVIGLTGGIGSGKSTVAGFLKEIGAVIIDADKVGHEAFRPGTDAWREVVAAFGERVLNADSTINRQKLGDLVFTDAAARARLNRIMHPRMYEVVKTEIERLRRSGTKVVVLEAPLLFEAGWDKLADEVWVTVASEAAILKRLKKRTGLSAEASRARIRSQLNEADRTGKADVVINTDCSLEEVKAKVRELWGGLEKEL